MKRFCFITLLLSCTLATGQELWRGLPWEPGQVWIDSTGALGPVYLADDPWIYSPSVESWLYLPEEETPSADMWAYWSKPNPLEPFMNGMRIDGATLTTEGNIRALASLPSHNLQSGITVGGFHFGDSPPDHLCLTVSRDVREDVAVSLWIGSEKLLDYAADYCSAGQRLRIPLAPEIVEQLVTAGSFQLSSSARLWVVGQNEEYPLLGPDFTREDEPKLPFERLKDSAITQFGWMHGCVLDGLNEMYLQSNDTSFADALDFQLGKFLTPSNVNYESPSNAIQVNTFGSIELTLPIAVIAKLHPNHSSINAAVSFWNSRTETSGLVTDGWATTTEGCYTIAYPMMVVAVQREDQAMIEKAFYQLQRRQEELWINDSIYLRNNDGYRTYRHWARGICWYYLGYVRTLIASGVEPTDEQKAHLEEVAAYVATYQTESGLWLNFINNIHQLPDTSGSSGIACALALAANRGWISASYLNNAVAAYNAISDYFVDSGFLDSVAPNNKRGETAQRANIRTCEPFALGLYGQLHAALIEAGVVD